MRLGIIDVGSNTVHLLVVDAHQGAQPLPAKSYKLELRLSEHVTEDGLIADSGETALAEFVRECLTVAEDQGVEELMAFATSAIREAPNGQDVLDRVVDDTGVKLEVLSGEDEARLTFLAARRWFGWSSGTLLVVDIGGGSLELAAGMDEDPDVAVSLPLGAGRLTRTRLVGDPPTAETIRVVRREIRARIAGEVRALTKAGAVDRAVGTSKTMRSRARGAGGGPPRAGPAGARPPARPGRARRGGVGTSRTRRAVARFPGAAPCSAGPLAARSLERAALADLVGRVGGMTAQQRSGMPGVSTSRARQLLAGALVAEASMDLLGIERLDICPWALREGVILRRLDTMA